MWLLRSFFRESYFQDFAQLRGIALSSLIWIKIFREFLILILSFGMTLYFALYLNWSNLSLIQSI